MSKKIKSKFSSLYDSSLFFFAVPIISMSAGYITAQYPTLLQSVI